MTWLCFEVLACVRCGSQPPSSSSLPLPRVLICAALCLACGTACRSVNVARTPGRLMALRRIADRLHSFGLDAHIIGPQECGERFNGLIRTDDLVGGADH
jgi:hypothetical protein